MKPTPRAPLRATPTDVRQHPAILRRLGLDDLGRGRGRAAAPLVWLCIASYMGWSRGDRSCWVTNATIAERTGLAVRDVERALALLVASGKVSVSYRIEGRKFRGGRKMRVLTLEIGEGGTVPRVEFPPAGWVQACWRMVKAVRERPTSSVALAVASYVWASASGRLVGDRPVTASLQVLRALTGSAHGRAFQRRLDALEQAGVLRREGKQWRHGMVVVGDLALEEMIRETDMALCASAPGEFGGAPGPRPSVLRVLGPQE